MATKTLRIAHFNDVYRVRQKISSKPKETFIQADQFAAKIENLRRRWKQDGGDGLVLFSGDSLNPSVESSVTRGEHMIPVLNACTIDAGCVGNHDMDFGMPHLTKVMAKCNFPWLFSNMVDVHVLNDPKRRGQVQGTQRYLVKEVNGVKVGVIGLVEKEWIATIPSFPTNFKYKDMVNTGLELSEELRKQHGCDVVIALTHARLPNDVQFCNATRSHPYGIDLVLGGHDHMYYVGKAAQYQGEPFDQDVAGAEEDEDALLVKSGTDFRDLSEIELVLQESGEGRAKVKALNVKRHRTRPEDPSSPHLQKLLDDLLRKISKSTSQPVCWTLTPWDVRSDIVRTRESAFGDLVADILMASYEETLSKGNKKAKEAAEEEAGEDDEDERPRQVDCAFICGGSLRGDSVYGPGLVSIGDILEILPFEDPIVVKELSGQAIWDALENGFSQYPAQEGRFPVVAGLKVRWDSTKPPGSRVLSVDLLDGNHREAQDIDNGCSYEVHNHRPNEDGGCTIEVRRLPLKVMGPLKKEDTYRVVTREYMAQGWDGYEALKTGRYIIDDENGVLMSTMVRKYLIGASYIWRLKQLREHHDDHHLSSRTSDIVKTARDETRSLPTSPNAIRHGARELTVGVNSTVDDAKLASASASARRLVVDHAPRTIADALHVGDNEHHSMHDRASKGYGVDADESETEGERKEMDVDEAALRRQDGDLAVVAPAVDGRLVDEAREGREE